MQLERLYRHWIDDLWAGDYDWARKLVTDEFIGHWPGEDVHGPEGLIAKIAEGHDALPPLRFSIEVGPFCAGDHVAGRWRGVGYQGDSEVTLVGNDILRSDGEKFVEYWVGSMVVP